MPRGGSYSQARRLLVRIEAEDTGVVGVAAQAPGRNFMAVTRFSAEAELLAQHLAKSNWQGRGFTGPVESIDRLADCWAKLSGKSKRILFSMRVLELRNVAPPAPAPGRMIHSPPHPQELPPRCLIRNFAS